ncbi:MAG: hypothetical protein QOG76_6962, partial [Pseudonocardiales bacterium]|nr:hypothetical protein [Pseudonocardiales bacterium]
FDVREHVVPLLSEALADAPATAEVLAEADAGEVTDHVSLLTGDSTGPDHRST